VSAATIPKSVAPAFCSKCGERLESDVRFCPKCGASTLSGSATVLDSESSGSVLDDISTLEIAVAEHPNDESYRNLLAVALCDDSVRDWWRDPTDNTLLCVSLAGLSHARRQLARANELHFSDPSLRGQIIERLQLVNSLEKRKFAGSWLMVVILGLFYIIPGGLWWYVNRRPVYLINKDYSMHKRTGKLPTVAAKMGGLQGKVYDFFERTSTEWGWLLGLVFMLTIGVVLSPIFMVLAYKQNYLDTKKEPA
jgi:zinc-ribbon domain